MAVLLAAVALTTCVGGSLAGTVSHAVAVQVGEVEPAPTPSAPPSTPAPTPGPPAITSPADDSAVTAATTRLSGTKAADTGVRITRAGGGDVCRVEPDPSDTFSCPAVALTAAAGITLTASAVLPDGSDGEASSIVVTSVPPPTIAASGTAPVNGLVRGTGIPSAVVTVIASSGESCRLTADATGAWACLLSGSAPDGPYRLTATQVAPFASGVRSDASAPADIVLDRTAPAPPTVTAPVAGSVLPGRDVGISGEGEDGATVTVFVGSASVCEAIVSAGRWSCIAADLPTGDHRVVAIQRDTALNSSAGSDAVVLSVGGRSASPTPSPRVPTPGPSTDATPSPSPSDAPSGDGPSEEDPAAPLSPGTRPVPPAPDDWDAATPFTAPLSSLLSSTTGAAGVRSVLLAASVASTIALAAVLFLRGSPAAAGADGRRRVMLTGRNRRDDLRVVVRTPAIPAASPSTAPTVVFALLGVAGLLILSRPVDGTPAYARLLFAAVTATALVSLVSVVVPALVSRMLGGGRLHTVVDPRGFLIVAGTAAASRALDLDPPALFALVVTATTAAAVGRATEGRVAAARIGGLAMLGVLAWGGGIVLSGVLEPGFAASLVTETLNVLTAAALGSATIMLVPLGTSTGRSLWAASRSGWLALAVVVVTIEVTLLGSRSPADADTVATVAVAGVVGAVSLVLSIWIWRRIVAPYFADEE